MFNKLKIKISEDFSYKFAYFSPRRGRGVYCFTSSYRYPISLEVFLEPSDSYFLFAEERGYHKGA
jgi:hypothetical protein